MEREYTVGALLVLVTIFVIALIIYFTVPEFSQLVGQIADEVFGTSIKARQLTEEQYTQEEAKKVFESVKKCINQLKEKQEEKCTCYLDYKGLPEEYYIRLTENGKELRLEKGNLKVSETENINIEGLNFCTLGKGFTYKTLLPKGIYLNSKGGALQINNKDFLKDTPEFYNLKDGNNKYICFVTSDIREEDVIKLRETKDCKTGTVLLDNKIKRKFQDFIQLYKNCKEYKKTGGVIECKCGTMDFNEIPEPYGILVSQQGSGTIFFLKNTDLKETILYNKAAKIIHGLLGGDKITEFKEKEKIEGVQEIVYYESNQDVYLAAPKDVSEMPMCTGKVNTYLKFNPSISKEEYEQRIVNFSAKSEPYFEIIYSAAKTYDVDLFLIVAMIEQESARTWNPKILSPSGAAGLMQLMPYTAEGLGLNKGGPKYKCREVSGYTICDCNSKATGLCDFKNDERFDPNKNVNAGVKYVQEAITVLDKNPKLDPTFENILTYYNAGPDNTKKYGGYKGVPSNSETIGYVKAICGYYEKLNTKVCYT